MRSDVTKSKKVVYVAHNKYNVNLLERNFTKYPFRDKSLNTLFEW